MYLFVLHAGSSECGLKWITRVPMTLKKTKEIIGSYLEKVKVSPETDPEIQEITREFQKKGYNPQSALHYVVQKDT